MKREERNQRTRDLILKSAVHEFATHGYEAASMNVICEVSHVSKGNMYHYFASKEELYLTCLQTCFTGLTEEIKRSVPVNSTSSVAVSAEKINRSVPVNAAVSAEEINRSIPIENTTPAADLLQRYFDARMHFFREHPDLAQLFCRCTAVPEPSMEDRIREVRAEFDQVNREVISAILRQKPIRKDLSFAQTAQLFTTLQTMWNAAAPAGFPPEQMEKKEETCRLLIDVFFYGILERNETH